MSATLTPRRFGMSQSGAPPTYATNSTSMADTLPTIDFNFNDLRERMQQFTVRFDDFIERGRKKVLEERNAFRMNIADQADQQRQRKQAITELESKSSSHAHIIAKETQETDEMREAIRSLTSQKEEHVARRDQLKTEIASTQSAIRQLRDAQAAHQRSLDAQAKHNVPELRFWETCLGMRLDGTGVDDRLKFVFVSIDDRDTERECWFELNIDGSRYEVASTKPRLNRDDVDAVQDRLNESNDLGPFLKTMRAMFVEVVKS
ncbi:unnamed protein product [Zymoseptoria tritici ST99CH_3D7]|uniref:Kinetochore protein SPC25 n=1 Tax=Zymoseptoria tritici (strain ST99CH_3D7) TaxID=1276538 RepID=A0A1X7RG11_ZYMT9|nr:unnamed protein product [Zymoseptoria tritici ST99CH_3D7]